MSDRPRSIRFINGRIYRDAEDRIPADTLVAQAGVVHFVGGQGDAPVDRGETSAGRALGAAEALSRRQTIRSYTQGGAYAMRQEAWRGGLAPGMAADLIALDRDPFDHSVDLASVRVLLTAVRGNDYHDAIGSRAFASGDVNG